MCADPVILSRGMCADPVILSRVMYADQSDRVVECALTSQTESWNVR